MSTYRVHAAVAVPGTGPGLRKHAVAGQSVSLDEIIHVDHAGQWRLDISSAQRMQRLDVAIYKISIGHGLKISIGQTTVSEGMNVPIGQRM